MGFYPILRVRCMFRDISVVVIDNSPKGNRNIIQRFEVRSPFKSCRFCRSMLKVLRGVGVRTVPPFGVVATVRAKQRPLLYKARRGREVQTRAERRGGLIGDKQNEITAGR
ncbi:hypothetical protein PHAMO_210345 [Magnetospirillum molischianum DSM 120]|uniref:Uncharacterized protein n=1 Tax=Magnetospirillum molischianum DSM 120 TaxID=1150626 RepID=H8FR46_MAGML|nr:hypothetical protein PHAMO_210345 [Magnetospirillum molischianum DSM 120]